MIDMHTTIHIPRNAIPLSSRDRDFLSHVLVSVSGKKWLVKYGESITFENDSKAVVNIFMGKRAKKIIEYVYPGKTYAVRCVDMVFSQAIVELVEI